jgi:hypothetical protein
MSNSFQQQFLLKFEGLPGSKGKRGKIRNVPQQDPIKRKWIKLKLTEKYKIFTDLI